MKEDLADEAEKDDSKELKISKFLLISALIVGAIVTIIFPPAILAGYAFYYLGHLLWIPWPFLIYADVKSNRNGRYRFLLRYLNVICAMSVAAFASGKLVLMDVWDGDDDFRGGIVVGWIVNYSMLFAAYCTLRFYSLLSLPPGKRSPKYVLEVSPPFIYLTVYVFLIFIALVISKVNFRQDIGMEMLFVICAGLTTFAAILNGSEVCSRDRTSLFMNGILFLSSVIGIGVCWYASGFRLFSEIAGFRHSAKPWYIFLASIVFSGASLIAALRRPRREVENRGK